MIKDRIWTLVSRKLSGEATPSELSELAQLITSESNADLYLLAIDEFWRIPPEKDEEFLEATYHLHLNRLKQKGYDLEKNDEVDEVAPLYLDYAGDKSKKISLRDLLVTSTLMVTLVCAFFIYRGFHNNVTTSGEKIAQSEISTKSGSRTKIQLPDGSFVWLNGSSRLVYDNQHFGEKLREVTLTGEGYFDILKNKDKPFVIHANNINIKVTGTTFNIKAYPGEKTTETSLVKGSIEVSLKDRAEKIIMKANDKLIINNDDAMDITHAKYTRHIENPVEAGILMSHLTFANDETTVVETAWVENKLVFDKETFEEVALKMERWYNVSIHFADEQLKQQRLTGTFEKETIVEALDALQLTTPLFKYKIKNQEINIFK